MGREISGEVWTKCLVLVLGQLRSMEMGCVRRGKRSPQRLPIRDEEGGSGCVDNILSIL